MPDDAMLYEPGPLQLLDPSRFPQPGAIGAEMESLVAPRAAEAFGADQSANGVVGFIVGGGDPDVEGDHAAMVSPVVNEMAAQSSSEHELDLSGVYSGGGASLAEIDTIAGQLPAEDSDYEEPQIPGEGTDDIPTGTSPGELGIEPTPLL